MHRGLDHIRILLADDHTITREGTRRLLEAEADLEVVAEAGDGEEAVHLAEMLLPDVLVLDINMPRLHGVQVAQRVGTLSQVRVIVLTGYDEERYVGALVRLGVKGYLLKSASARELVRALRTVHAGGTHFQCAATAALRGMSGEPLQDGPTPKELEVLRLVAEGRKNREIAQLLCVSERTVHFHLRNLFEKLQVSSRSEMVYVAQQRRWLA